MTGAAAVADETRHFADHIRAAVPMRVNGRAVHVIATGGHASAIIDIKTHAAVVTRIAIRSVFDTDALEAPSVQASEKCDL